MAAALQSNTNIDTAHCSPPGLVRNCRFDDGTVYVEVKTGDRLTRRGTAPNGETWTELIDYSSGGARLSGYDWRGRTWYQSCRPEFGTQGTDRNGEVVSLPPKRTKDGFAPCFDYTPR